MQHVEGKLARVLAQATCLYDRLAIDNALDIMAKKVTADLKERRPLALCVLNGGVIFSGHFLMRLDFSVQLDYAHITRYGGGFEGGELKWIAKPSVCLKGRTVLLLDDIFDQGYTLEALRDGCLGAGAEAVYSAVLLTKEHSRDQVPRKPDYSALTVQDQYVFGFGMDYEHELRNLNGIYALEGALK